MDTKRPSRENKITDQEISNKLLGALDQLIADVFQLVPNKPKPPINKDKKIEYKSLGFGPSDLKKNNSYSENAVRGLYEVLLLAKKTGVFSETTWNKKSDEEKANFIRKNLGWGTIFTTALSAIKSGGELPALSFLHYLDENYYPFPTDEYDYNELVNENNEWASIFTMEVYKTALNKDDRSLRIDLTSTTHIVIPPSYSWVPRIVDDRSYQLMLALKKFLETLLKIEGPDVPQNESKIPEKTQLSEKLNIIRARLSRYYTSLLQEEDVSIDAKYIDGYKLERQQLDDILSDTQKKGLTTYEITDLDYEICTLDFQYAAYSISLLRNCGLFLMSSDSKQEDSDTLNLRLYQKNNQLVYYINGEEHTVSGLEAKHASHINDLFNKTEFKNINITSQLKQLEREQQEARYHLVQNARALQNLDPLKEKLKNHYNEKFFKQLNEPCKRYLVEIEDLYVSQLTDLFLKDEEGESPSFIQSEIKKLDGLKSQKKLSKANAFFKIISFSGFSYKNLATIGKQMLDNIIDNERQKFSSNLNEYSKKIDQFKKDKARLKDNFIAFLNKKGIPKNKTTELYNQVFEEWFESAKDAFVFSDLPDKMILSAILKSLPQSLPFFGGQKKTEEEKEYSLSSSDSVSEAETTPPISPTPSTPPTPTTPKDLPQTESPKTLDSKSPLSSPSSPPVPGRITRFFTSIWSFGSTTKSVSSEQGLEDEKKLLSNYKALLEMYKAHQEKFESSSSTVPILDLKTEGREARKDTEEKEKKGPEVKAEEGPNYEHPVFQSELEKLVLQREKFLQEENSASALKKEFDIVQTLSQKLKKPLNDLPLGLKDIHSRCTDLKAILQTLEKKEEYFKMLQLTYRTCVMIRYELSLQNKNNRLSSNNLDYYMVSLQSLADLETMLVGFSFYEDNLKSIKGFLEQTKKIVLLKQEAFLELPFAKLIKSKENNTTVFKNQDFSKTYIQGFVFSKGYILSGTTFNNAVFRKCEFHCLLDVDFSGADLSDCKFDPTLEGQFKKIKINEATKLNWDELGNKILIDNLSDPYFLMPSEGSTFLPELVELVYSKSSKDDKSPFNANLVFTILENVKATRNLYRQYRSLSDPALHEKHQKKRAEWVLKHVVPKINSLKELQTLKTKLEGDDFNHTFFTEPPSFFTVFNRAPLRDLFLAQIERQINKLSSDQAKTNKNNRV